MGADNVYNGIRNLFSGRCGSLPACDHPVTSRERQEPEPQEQQEQQVPQVPQEQQAFQVQASQEPAVQEREPQRCS